MTRLVSLEMSKGRNGVALVHAMCLQPRLSSPKGCGDNVTTDDSVVLESDD